MRARAASIAMRAPRARSSARCLMRSRSCRLPYVLDDDLHRGDGQARQALDLVADLRADGGRDLRKVEPVLDDDVERDLHARRVAADGDAVAAQELADPRARCEPDDAVAALGRLADDLRDDIARDRDRPAG